ncbi:Pls/PosA family non-ribosomal peptide synthetase [Bacillus sp. FDAARGOS_1420]|uniref:Pls/PosA family non-ribosomal peptide synthetase n=1 Tax=unclassified Bacillus (in: firmicutes) TaxID=185979 RepID=UPI001C5B4210|nr:Pls/PosA family non-ribosomal peptide synthetase [Bacillus sp. FDAARGOS_1420]MBW3496709.1 amino acid adenylation domain-containing protein [Bacillus sp. FDAARGOS_1420]
MRPILEKPRGTFLPPSEWNYGQRKSKLLREECLHQVFEETVDRYEARSAIIYDDRTVTYGELEVQANQLARYLRYKGIGCGSRVAILLEPSIESYISMLGIMKAGAAYVPLDPSYPEDRVQYILQDCDITAVIMTESITTQYHLACLVVLLDQESVLIANESTGRLDKEETQVQYNDLSYIIYTSGTTGRPKGVLIEHHTATHVVRASQTVYNVLPSDRVYQGFTIAFDASVEEIWMAFSNGAALIVGTRKLQQSGMDLPKMLTKLGVTVLSCVPTLLAVWKEDIPTLRLLIVGGEDCPSHIVKYWCRPGRRMMNTYGPTEATVIATYTECDPGKSVTIGKPLPNYTVYILDEQMNPVSVGESGELYIGGAGLARGYNNREDLTKEKFVDNPFCETAFDSPRLYRTGDLVRFNEQGDIEFLGRIDSQVKIRGYRVELSEIETVIMNIPDIRNAIVNVYEQVPGLQVLVAYLLLEEGKSIDRSIVHNRLKERLPAYMVPSCIEVLDELPTLVSGKIDRKSLPAPTEQQRLHKEHIAPRNKTEEVIARVWQGIFQQTTISITDHFFNDLGGHSLFAALVVSKLREHSMMTGMAVSDIYAHPTIEQLSHFIQSQYKSETKHSVSKGIGPVSDGVYKRNGFMQGVSIYVLTLLASLPFVLVYLHLANSSWRDEQIFLAVISMFAIYCPSMIIISIAAKWLLIGRFKEGEYPLWGSYYFRWWLVRRIQGLAPIRFLTGTPFLKWYYRLMGAKIGTDCYIGTQHMYTFDLIEIGNNSSIGVDAQFLGYTVEGTTLKIGKISVGRNCYIGSNTVISPHTIMKDHSQLGEQSMLPSNVLIPQNERWIGSPARLTNIKDEHVETMLISSTNYNKVYCFGLGVLYVIGLIMLMLIPSMSFLPALLLMQGLFSNMGAWELLLAPVFSFICVLTLCIEIALLKRIILGNIKEGQYSLYSGFYIRKWFVDKLLTMSLLFNNSLYATLYAAPFLRMLGAKIGKMVEVSTVTNIAPDLLIAGEESFIADSVSIGTPKVFHNQIYIAKTRIGSRTFIGNSAHIEGGKTIGNSCLIGVMSIPPEEKEPSNDTSWLGSPSIFLPKRDINTTFSEEETYHPTRSLYIKRLMIEFFRITLPGSFAIWISSFLLFTLREETRYLSVGGIIALFPFFVVLSGLLATGVVALIKKLLIGRYEQTAKPLWSTFVWRSELVTALYENVTVPYLLNLFLGTPFAPYILGWFGTKMGKRVFLDSTHISEFDLVQVGNQVAINLNSTLQTHLFEDRVMKMSNLVIGDNCSIGNGSVVLYDTIMQQGASLGNLSLMMKGETFPASTQWEGTPAQYRHATERKTIEG